MIQAHLLLPPSRWKTLGKTESLPKSKQRTFSPPPSPFLTPRSHYYTVAHLLDTVKNPKRTLKHLFCKYMILALLAFLAHLSALTEIRFFFTVFIGEQMVSSPL